MKKKFVVMLVLLAIAAAPAMAGYRLAFVSSVRTDALSDDITTYNAWVQGLADTAGIGMGGAYGDLEWNVVGSTAAVDARDNTGTNPEVDAGVPIYLVDGDTDITNDTAGTLIANDNADLWDGEIAHIINQDENGALVDSGMWVLSGTGLDGTAAGQFGPLGSGGDVQQGNGTSTTQWIYRTWTGTSSTQKMYAMSEVIPEPATIALLGFGGMALLRRRKK